MILEKRPTSEIKKAAREEGMRFLRESAVERVMLGHDDAARDQQGDVRRMSTLSTRFAAGRDAAAGRGRDRRQPRVGGEPSTCAAGRAIVRGARGRAAAGRRARAVADATEHPRSRRRSSARVGRVLERLGRPRRVGLVVPDPVAKVSLVRFEQVPAARQDLDQLVRWQVRKAAPFPIEEAQVSYVPGRPGRPTARSSSCRWRGATSSRNTKQLCAEAGAHAGMVDLATFNVINAVLAEPAPPRPGDWLLVNVAAGLRVDRDSARHRS